MFGPFRFSKKDWVFVITNSYFTILYFLVITDTPSRILEVGCRMTESPADNPLLISVCRPLVLPNSTSRRCAVPSTIRYANHLSRSRNKHPDETLIESSGVDSTTILASIRNPSPSVSRSHGGSTKSAITLTRFSSTPNAETFKKADGSTRRTTARRGIDPPQCSI